MSRRVSWRGPVVVGVVVVATTSFFAVILSSLLHSLLPLTIILVACLVYGLSLSFMREKAVITRLDLVQLRDQLCTVTLPSRIPEDIATIRNGLTESIDNMAPICRGYGFVWPATTYFKRVNRGLRVLAQSDPAACQVFARCLDLVETEYKKAVIGAPSPELLRLAEALRDSLVEYKDRLTLPPPPP